MDEKPWDRVTLVVSDGSLYDKFYDYAARLQFEADESGIVGSSDAPSLDLMLFDERESMIKNVTPFYDYD